MTIALIIDKRFPNLNEAQRAIVGHLDGPLLVIAGPGSGKTRSIVLRALNLLLLERRSPGTSCSAPSRAHDSIRARVAEIQARAAERTEVTVASLTKQLIEDRDFARSLDNAAAAVTASAAIMKLHGLGSEKVKVETQSVLDYLTDLSRRDIPVEADEAPVEGDAIH